MDKVVKDPRKKLKHKITHNDFNNIVVSGELLGTYPVDFPLLQDNSLLNQNYPTRTPGVPALPHFPELLAETTAVSEAKMLSRQANEMPARFFASSGEIEVGIVDREPEVAVNCFLLVDLVLVVRVFWKNKGLRWSLLCQECFL